MSVSTKLLSSSFQYELMMHLYSALLCIAVHPKRFSIMCGGEGGGLSSTTTSVQHPFGWCDGCHRTMVPVRSPHTSYRWRGERDRANQVDGDYWEAMIDKGQWWEFGQDNGVTPLLFTRSAMGFLMTTESQDLGLTSHPKDSAFWQYSVPVTILGRKGPHRLQGEHPLLVSLTPLQAAT